MYWSHNAVEAWKWKTLLDDRQHRGCSTWRSRKRCFRVDNNEKFRSTWWSGRRNLRVDNIEIWRSPSLKLKALLEGRQYGGWISACGIGRRGYTTPRGGDLPAEVGDFTWRQTKWGMEISLMKWKQLLDNIERWRSIWWCVSCNLTVHNIERWRSQWWTGYAVALCLGGPGFGSRQRCLVHKCTVSYRVRAMSVD